MSQVFGRRAEHQHRRPPPALIGRNVEEPLPYWTQGPQIMMPAKQRLEARQLLRVGQADANLIQ